MDNEYLQRNIGKKISVTYNFSVEKTRDNILKPFSIMGKLVSFNDNYIIMTNSIDVEEETLVPRSPNIVTITEFENNR